MGKMDSMPIYVIGNLLLNAPFNSPIFPILTFEFLSIYLKEQNGISVGHRYFDTHPYVQFITKLRKRLVEGTVHQKR
jgi:hypothetical protein